MTVRSVLDIDVNDVNFQKFYNTYKQYQALLQATPAAWQKINQEIKGTGAGFEKLVAKFAAQNVQAKLALIAQKEADRITRTTADRWRDIARSTKSVASNVKDITLSLLRWGAITTAVTGLLGAGSLFGIDRLALGVSAGRRSSLGLGLGYGEQQAFSNFARLVDPDSFLGGVAGAKFDVTKRVGLLGAGLTPGEIAGDTAQTAVALLQNLKRIADTTNPALFAQVIGARQLGQFVSPEDLERLRNTSPGEFAQLLKQYGTRRTQFDLPQDVQKSWQDLSTQLSNASTSIFNTFVRGLAPLAPGLDKLSGAFENVVRAFLGSPALERWIKTVDQGLEKFAAYIGTDEFATKVENFVTGVGNMASAIGHFLSWFGFGGDKTEGRARISDRLAAANSRRIARGETVQNPAANWLLRNSAWASFPQIPISGDPMTDLLSLVRQDETRGRPGMEHAVSPYGATGLYQIMPGTAKQYGRDPSRLQDVAYNEATAKIILADLLKRYHGNLDRVLAAYHSGKARGDDMKLGPYGRDYVAYARSVKGYDKVQVEINNNTGGNANVTVNGLKN
jgi:hypothetical protein